MAAQMNSLAEPAKVLCAGTTYYLLLDPCPFVSFVSKPVVLPCYGGVSLHQTDKQYL